MTAENFHIAATCGDEDLAKVFARPGISLDDDDDDNVKASDVQVVKNMDQDMPKRPVLTEDDMYRLEKTVSAEYTTPWKTPEATVTILTGEKTTMKDVLEQVKRALHNHPRACRMTNKENTFCMEYGTLGHNQFLRLWHVSIPEDRRRQGWGTQLVTLLCKHAVDSKMPALVVGPLVGEYMLSTLKKVGGFSPRPWMPLDAWYPIADSVTPF